MQGSFPCSEFNDSLLSLEKWRWSFFLLLNTSINKILFLFPKHLLNYSNTQIRQRWANNFFPRDLDQLNNSIDFLSTGIPYDLKFKFNFTSHFINNSIVDLVFHLAHRFKQGNYTWRLHKCQVLGLN